MWHLRPLKSKNPPIKVGDVRVYSIRLISYKIPVSYNICNSYCTASIINGDAC